MSPAAQQRLEPVQAARVPEAMALQTPGTDMDELFGASSPAAAAHVGSHISAQWAIRSRGDAALATPSRERSSWGQAAGSARLSSRCLVKVLQITCGSLVAAFWCTSDGSIGRTSVESCIARLHLARLLHAVELECAPQQFSNIAACSSRFLA